jgi:polysaccharide deacetylase family protein (PEP-CTERM system associated)
MVSKVNSNPSVFSVDVEDGISLVMRDLFNKPIEQTDRCVRTTREILDLLAKKEVKATFFTLGIVGEKFPYLVKEIIEQGHELAVHGHNHLKFFQMTPKQALEEVSKAKDVLEQLSGVEIGGHRAPAFSISKKTPWAFEVLIEAGFTYDSSIMPVKSTYYGWDDFPQHITTVKTKNGIIKEFPISVLEILGKQLPFSGGSYLRLLPTWLLKKAFKEVTNKNPAVVYVHPYEFDQVRYPDFYFEEMLKIDWKKRIKLNTNFINRSKSIGKIADLMDDLKFETMEQVIKKKSNSKDVFEV